MARITYKEQGKQTVIDYPVGKTILEASLHNDVPHYHVCNKRARCSTCRVRVLKGLENTGPRTEPETRIAQDKNWSYEIRLACQTTILGDLTLERLVMDDADVEMIYFEGSKSALPGNDGHEEMLAVLFCDIGGFSTFAASHLPYDVVHLLNRFYREVSEPVLANGGYIDKYLGDGLMAVFGMNRGLSGTVCMNAVKAGLRIVSRCADLNTYAQAQFGYDFTLRVGIHYGPAIVGEIGHPSKRQLTVLGDTVNVANRIEVVNKELGTALLVSDEVYRYVASEVETSGRQTATLRGIDREYAVYEITGLTNPDAVFIVQTTYERITPHTDRFATLFYKHLFALDPAIQPLFREGNFRNQRRMLMNMIGVAVRGMNHFDDLVPILRDLGTRHQSYQVKHEYYPLAGMALLQTLEDFFGDEFTPQVRQAWSDVIDLIIQTMMSADVPEAV